MKLNSDGKLARFYDWNYPQALPDSLCPFFWKMLFAALFFPITWPTAWRRRVDDSFIVERFLFGALHNVVVGLLIFWAIRSYEDPWAALWVIKVVALAIGGIAAGVAGVAGTIYFWADSETGRELRSVVAERKDGFKNKYCPRIEWR